MTFLSFSSQMNKASDARPQEGLFLNWNKERPNPSPIETMSEASPSRLPPKKKTTRRAGSCEPCRKSKIKCDGKRPECTGCSRRKRTKCKDPCVYVPAKERSAAARQQQMSERHVRSTTSPLSTVSEDSEESDDEVLSPDVANEIRPPMVYGKDEFFGTFSLARCIDQFKSLCPSSKPGVPDSVAQCNGIEAFDALPAPPLTVEEPELLVPKAQHSLDHYLPCKDLDVMPREIRDMGWKAINMKEKLVDEGRMHEAYRDFPRLAREARFFRQLNFVPRPKMSSTNHLQSQVEQKIYRLIIDMDVRICSHLGMPLEVQPDKIPSTTRLTAADTDRWSMELEKSQSEFRQLAFDILSLFPSISTDEEVTTSDRIMEDLSTRWTELRRVCSEKSSIPDAPPEGRLLFVEHQIDRQVLSLLLACTISDRHKDGNLAAAATPSMPATVKRRKKSTVLDMGRPQVALEAAEGILALFAGLGRLSDGCTWTCAYAVFCAAAITSIAIIQGMPGVKNINNIKQAVDFFGKATRQRGKGYGRMSAPLAKLWASIKSAEDPKTEARYLSRAQHQASPNVKLEAKSLKKSPRRKRQSEVLDEEAVEPSAKRSRRSPRITRPTMLPTALTYGQEMSMGSVHHPRLVNGYTCPSYGWDAGQDVSEPSSGNVSFSSIAPPETTQDMVQESPLPVRAGDDPFLYEWYHPPLQDPQPPHPAYSELFPAPSYYTQISLRPDFPNYPAGMHPQGTTPATQRWPINSEQWPATAHGLREPAYDGVQAHESRRASVVSQHELHAPPSLWHNNAALVGVPVPPFHPAYPNAAFYGNEEMPVMTNGEWTEHEQYQYDNSERVEDSPWQLEQQHRWATTTVS